MLVTGDVEVLVEVDELAVAPAAVLLDEVNRAVEVCRGFSIPVSSALLNGNDAGRHFFSHTAARQPPLPDTF